MATRLHSHTASLKEHTKKKSRDKGDSELVDWISLLPDEILVFILSSLELKNAAITSALSRRWKHLWRFVTCLNFNAIRSLDNVFYAENYIDLLENERPKYVNWVNKVVKIHQSQTIEEFKVFFDLEQNSKDDIDQWFHFAVKRNVQWLQMHLADHKDAFRYRIRYTFPYNLLGLSKGATLNKIPSNSFTMSSCPFVGFKSLKVLSLICVNVSGEALEHLLSICPHLERMCICSSEDLKSLKVSGPHVALKLLEICCCVNIKYLEISNAVTFCTLVYDGPIISLLLENVPFLSEVSVGGSDYQSLKELLRQLSCFLSQLKALTLVFDHTKEMQGFSVSPEFSNLKILVVKRLSTKDTCLLGLTCLIEASPFLQKFVLQEFCIAYVIDKREAQKAVKHSHYFLEELEIAGYYGGKSQLELMMYVLENAVALKKITIDPLDLLLLKFREGGAEIEKENAARICVKQQLEGIVPQRIELVIL